jgi:hypothetical protein
LRLSTRFSRKGLLNSPTPRSGPLFATRDGSLPVLRRPMIRISPRSESST